MNRLDRATTSIGGRRAYLHLFQGIAAIDAAAQSIMSVLLSQALSQQGAVRVPIGTITNPPCAEEEASQ